jgi:hypothetical protein
MAISRKIYTNSNVEIKAHDVALNGGSPAGTALYAKPNTVQNATFTLTIPRADVNSFGIKGVVSRPQLEATSATVEFSWIPLIDSPVALDDALDAGAAGGDEATNPYATLSERDIGKTSNDTGLFGDTLADAPKYVGVNVHNVGAIMNGLLTSLSGDATVGALPTFTASFLGAQSDGVNGVAGWATDGYGNSTASNSGGAQVSIATAEPHHIAVYGAVADDNGCVQSGAFTWDMPVELVLCLGDDPATKGEALSSPPGTASITIEGLTGDIAVATANQMVTKLKIGAYRFDVGSSAKIDSRTHNMAVGELFGTYNYVVGSTADSCDMD